MSYARYSLYVAFAGTAAMCSLSDAKAQSTIAPPKCVSAVVVQDVLGYIVRFHNNCGYTVTVYWGPKLGDGGGTIQSSVDIPSGDTIEHQSSVSEITYMRYYSCPASNYKLTYKTSLGVTVTVYNDTSTLVCWRL
jgi:hypothetical protein